MKDGFIKVAAAMPKVTVADVTANTENIKSLILAADEKKVNLLVFPELSLTGYTCGDLFFNDALITSAKNALLDIAKFTENKSPAVVVGLPLEYDSKLYNCAAVIKNGDVLGFVAKTHISTNNENRYFVSAKSLPHGGYIDINDGYCVELSNNMIFVNEAFNFGVEIGTDLSAPVPQNQKLALCGAHIIVNPAAITATAGKFDYCKSIVKDASLRLGCGYVLASAGIGESSTDTAFSGLSIIAENGNIIAKEKPFSADNLLITEIDIKLLASERYKNAGFASKPMVNKVYFEQEIEETEITRKIEKNPFLPETVDKKEYLEEILQIQSHALARRISHTNAKKAVIGISGGLDSTLALLVAVRAMKILNRPSTDILAITMPCFGTTKRTRSNSEILCDELNVSFKEINITDAVKQHFKDIEQDENVFDATYENSQARERTQVLMDIANKENGFVIGTGDLSELALGWATYNGDHMSMYGVNGGVPKTLIRHIVHYEALNSKEALKNVLFDILDTPVSPELLPADNKGEIAQKTEDLVGPYELHDFFIYYMLRYGFSPKKLYRLANAAFEGIYDSETVLKWLKIFTRRFFTQQFKRSCLPDGPMVGEISLSPRGGWSMPSDASFNLWLKELEELG
ncbi:MAG: NAD(+) synthase [Clostridia bacterium]|nr:NAD(+) synthase [Clostridia bacterium]